MQPACACTGAHGTSAPRFKPLAVPCAGWAATVALSPWERRPHLLWSRAAVKRGEHYPERQAALVVIALALGLAYVWGFLVPREIELAAPRLGNIGSWDLETYFLPKFTFGSREMLNGRLPVWNPFEFGGVPLLAAAQPAALYPPKILAFALLEPGTALKVFFAAHTALAGILFLLFAREQGMGLAGVLAGVLCYAFSRGLLTSTGHPVILANGAWVPLVFLLSERIARTGGARSIAGLALVVGVQLTAGYPQFVLDCALLLALHATVRWATGEWRQPPWKTLPVVAASFGIGAVIAAAQLLPLGDLLRVTGRWEMAGRVVAAAPEIPRSTAWLVLLANGVPGLAAPALAGATRRSIAPATGFLFCVLLILGGWRLLRLVPGFGAARLPGTWALLTQFFVAWLVACGADGLMRAGIALARWRRAILIIAAGCWAGACLSASIAPDLLSPAVGRWLGLAPGGRALAVSVLGATGALALAACGLTWRRASLTRALVPVGVLLVVLAHLSGFPFGHSVGKLGVPEHPHRSATLIPEAELRQGRVLSIVDARGGFHVLDRVENPFGREGSLPPPRFTAVEKRLGVVVQQMKVAWDELAGRQGLLDTIDARYLVVPRLVAGKLGGIDYEQTGYGDAFLSVLRARDPVGRAWGVYGARLVESPDQALELLMSPDFDARRQVIVEHPPRGRYAERARRPATPARVHRVSPTLTEVEINMTESGFLVLADSCFPGWAAEVDGRPAEIQCANYLVRGVELEAGPHRVRFVYRSAWVRWGLGLSALGLVGAGAALAGAFRRRAGHVPDLGTPPATRPV